METKINYTIVGLFMTLLITVIIIMGLWLSTGIQTDHSKIYLVYMNESVAGLSDNAPVKFNGVNVGMVKDIKLNLNNPQQVIITLKLKPDVPITETTTAVLMEQGITGIAYLGLKTGKPAPLLKPKQGQEYPVIPAQPSFLVKLDSTIESLSENLGAMSDHVKMLLSEKNIKAMEDTLQNIKQVSNALAGNSKNISESLQNLSVLMKNSAHASKDFPEILKSIKQTTVTIDHLSQDLRLTANSINKTAEQSNVAIQSFSNSLLPETFDTMSNINDLAKNLKSVSAQLKQNPALLVKGTTPPKPGPGE